MNIIKLFLILLFFGTVAACSSSQETAKEDGVNGEESVYVFDDVSDVEDEKTTEESESVESALILTEESVDTTSSVPMHIVQIGAFSTEPLAKRYVEQMSSKIDYELNVHQNEDVNLYVVQLPPFGTREEAENVRNELWKIKEFKDAFIVPQF